VLGRRPLLGLRRGHAVAGQQPEGHAGDKARHRKEKYLSA
jgi:hypothetical protein